MAVNKWHTLSSRYLVREKWATLRVDTCKLPDGIIKNDYYVLEYPNWANAVAVTKDGKIILVRQYRLAAGIESLEVPGGVVEKDEFPEDAVKRELLEETGFTFSRCQLVAELYPNPATSNNKVYTYLLTGGIKTHEQALDEHELLDVEFYSISEIRQLLKQNMIAQAMHVSALFYGLEAYTGANF